MMIHLKCLLETSKLLESSDDFSSNDLFLILCKVIDIVDSIIYFEVIEVLVWCLSTIFAIFAFFVIFIEKDSLIYSLIWSSKLSIEKFSYFSTLMTILFHWMWLNVRIVSRWVNQRKSELNSAWSLKIAITEY